MSQTTLDYQVKLWCSDCQKNVIVTKPVGLKHNAYVEKANCPICNSFYPLSEIACPDCQCTTIEAWTLCKGQLSHAHSERKLTHQVTLPTSVDLSHHIRRIEIAMVLIVLVLLALIAWLAAQVAQGGFTVP